MKSQARKVTIAIFFVVLLVVAAAFYFLRQKPEVIIKQAVDIEIVNADVVTMDSQLHIYNPGYIVIKNSQIIALGHGNPPAEYVAQKTINAGGKVVMPGLVNTHSHAAMTLLTGLGQGQNLQSWLNTMSGYESNLTSSDVYWGTLLAADKMIKSGTTVFNDMYYFSDQAAKAASDAGMRAVVRIPTTMSNGQIGFGTSTIAQYQNNPLITFSLAPNPLLDYTSDELKQISDYALSKNYIVHIHFEEDAQARTDAVAKYNLTPLQLITQGGLLRNKIVLAHAVDTTPAEISDLGQYPNAGVSFNPLSEYNLQTPLTPVSALLNTGVTVAFGTDGEPSSNLDMFAQIKFAASGYLNCSSGQKFCQNGKTIDPEEIIRMATINGADILGLGNSIGSLEPGKQADIIIVAPENSGDDIYSSLVYNTSGSDVVDSVINGKLVMENKQLITINEAQVLQKTQAISESLNTQK
jgi:5-methylthioadenosine/S-adenosylhomocysteine deaminase